MSVAFANSILVGMVKHLIPIRVLVRVVQRMNVGISKQETLILASVMLALSAGTGKKLIQILVNVTSVRKSLVGIKKKEIKTLVNVMNVP